MSLASVDKPNQWFLYRNIECCKVCGIVRRRDEKNKPCRGPVAVRTREESNETTMHLAGPAK